MKNYKLNIYGFQNKRHDHNCKSYVLYDGFNRVKKTESRYEMKIFMDIIGIKYKGSYRRYGFDRSSESTPVYDLVYQLDYEG